jgi:hypothetical protein
MLDVVKFTWANKHGYWIPAAWTLALTDENAVGKARLGRPSMTDFKVLGRKTIPEELRLTGRAQWALSMVILYDPKANEYTPSELLEAMVVQTA